MQFRRRINLFSAASLAAAALLLSVAAGCSQEGRANASEKKQADAPTSQENATDLPANAPAAPPVAADNQEQWSVHYIQGKRVGYDHRIITPTVVAGKKMLLIDHLTHLSIMRFGQTTEQKSRLTSMETPEGELIEFQCEMQQGTVPLKSDGKVVDDKLQITTTTAGKKTTDSIDWSPEYKGFLGVEQSLLQKPLKPGERRTIKTLMAVMNRVATVEMVAKQREDVELLAGTYELLKIEATVTLPGGQRLNQTIWCDRAGNALKSVLKEMGLETFLATKEQALEKTEAADLGMGASVEVEGPISDPHKAEKMSYRVRLEGGDPASIFVSGPSQKVASVDEQTADITVYALRPGSKRAAASGDADKPTSADIQPNNYIQSDNAKVVALAKKAVGDEKDLWKAVVKLENFVNEHIEEKGFSEAFATAAEVAEKPVGDCTEHAVLLAALARAQAIPARVAMGLVFIPKADGEPGGAFCYHMWTEVYVDGCWIPVDATGAAGGTGAGHLKLGHSSLKGSAAFVDFLRVTQVLGRLKIQSRQEK